jgi:hypothetical protein
MWEHYRKTFWGTQAIIFAVTLCVYWFVGRLPARAAVFFVIMQVFSLIGAAWGARLRRVAQARAERLPLAGCR